MYLGIDIGSVSIKYALIDEKCKVLESAYFRTNGDVIGSVKKLLKSIKAKKVKGVATTGSARKFVSTILSADLNVDEVTTHRAAVTKLYPSVKTIFEIGGQDSKIIYFNKKTVGFDMNHVCAAGTGSFLDQQAARLKLSLKDFYKKGLETKDYHKIASRCTVFAESDMVHAQQSGIPLNQVIRGVHRGLINNYFTQLCRGKDLKPDFLFEGGTSENPVLVEEMANKLLEEKLITDKKQLIVPKYNKIMGAIGAAIICMNKKINNLRDIPEIKNYDFLDNTECTSCFNKCGAKITNIKINDKIVTIGRSCQQ